MNTIQFPPHISDGEPKNIELEGVKSIVVVGANGAGKTRFGVWIEKQSHETLRISAQKSLAMPDFVSPTSLDRAEQGFYYGNDSPGQDISWLQNQGKTSYRWGNSPETHLLSDFNSLLTLLQTEEYQISTEYRQKQKTSSEILDVPSTKLDIIKKLWEVVIPHRKLVIGAGTIITKLNDDSAEYNASQMSDGERVVFYFIGEALCARPNSLIIIDEPELHLHKAIQNILWNEIEKLRSDCTFIYLTHDTDFATGREAAKIVWVKSFNGSAWEYTEIDDQPGGLPQELYLEIIGSKRPILFMESTESKFDKQLYTELFPEYLIKPVGGCGKVIELTKSFNELTEFHNNISIGIIDRDRRADEDVESLNNRMIFVLEVAEIENLFLIEEIIKFIASHMDEEPAEVFSTYSNNVIKKFENDIEEQACTFALNKFKKQMNRQIPSKGKEFTETSQVIQSYISSYDFNDIYSQILTSFRGLIDSKDYLGILKVYNQKGLINSCNLLALCGVKTSDKFYSLVINELKNGNVVLKGALLSKIPTTLPIPQSYSSEPSQV